MVALRALIPKEVAIILKLLIYGFIAAAIYFGLRRIMVDWRHKFRDMDQKTRERDLKERQRPDVVELKRDKDGVFRPKNKTGEPDDKN